MKEHVQECPVNGMPIHMSDLDQYYGRYECQCEILRACEQRVLDAAREALDALPTEQTVKEGVSEFWVEINHAIAAIDALREKPLASGGIYAGPPIPLGDGCVIPKSDAIDALREKP